MSEKKAVKLIVIDGQGGKLGKLLVTEIKKALPNQYVLALGTNSIATAAMLKAGADNGATGENPIVVNCHNADIIVGALGIIVANSLLGEITPIMASAIGSSPAIRVLIPIAKCNNVIIGNCEMPLIEQINLAVEKTKDIINRFN